MTRLFFTGDTGTGGESQRQVAGLMARLAEGGKPEAIVLCGDNFMDFGVSSVDDPQWDEKFVKMYEAPSLAGVPFFSVLGNHDYKGKPRAQIAYSHLNSRWNMPARHFTVSFGAVVDLVCFDTNWPDYSGLGLFSMDRVARRARRLPGAWKIAIGHRPLLTGGKYERLSWNVRWFLRSFLKSAKADVYFSGHDHNLQHLVDSESGLHQIVCGAGGSPLQPVRMREHLSRFAKSAHGVVVGEFSERTAKFQFFTVDEPAPVYEFELERSEAQRA